MAIQKTKEADIPATSISAKPIQSPFALVEKTAAQIHHILLRNQKKLTPDSTRSPGLAAFLLFINASAGFDSQGHDGAALCCRVQSTHQSQPWVLCPLSITSDSA